MQAREWCQSAVHAELVREEGSSCEAKAGFSLPDLKAAQWLADLKSILQKKKRGPKAPWFASF